MMSGPRPALACGAAPTIGSPYTTPASPACSATWVADRSRVFGAAPAQTGVHHQPTRSYAQINGNMERFNRIPLDLVSPHDARNSGPVDRAAPPRITKGGCYARAKRAKTGAWSGTVASRRWGCGPTPRVPSGWR
jgi:hypothetical protein